METYVTVQGNLTADPAPRTTANGATLVRLRVASNPRRFDRESGEFKDGEPMYIGVSCWRGLGANALASLRKGDSVVVFGKLLYREYDDAQGVKQRNHEIDALAVGPDLNRWPADPRRPARRDEAPDVAEAAPPAADEVPAQAA